MIDPAKFASFSDDELYMLKQQALKSSFEIVMGGMRVFNKMYYVIQPDTIKKIRKIRGSLWII